MNKIRATFRGLLVFPLALLFILPGLFKSIFSKNWLPLALYMRQLWAKTAMFFLGIRCRKEGCLPPGGPFIYIGNHRSYIDPVIALSDIEALPVAKAEVSKWPIIGFCAKATGIMWVERDSKTSRSNTIKAMQQTLSDGYSVLVYPEGTTHIDPTTREFKKGAFRLAATMGIPVVPIGIEYHDIGDAWVGDDTFIPHFIRCFGKKRTFVDIGYGPAISSNNADELMTNAKEWIDRWLAKQMKPV